MSKLKNQAELRTIKIFTLAAKCKILHHVNKDIFKAWSCQKHLPIFFLNDDKNKKKCTMLRPLMNFDTHTTPSLKSNLFSLTGVCDKALVVRDLYALVQTDDPSFRFDPQASGLFSDSSSSRCTRWAWTSFFVYRQGYVDHILDRARYLRYTTSAQQCTRKVIGTFGSGCF